MCRRCGCTELSFHRAGRSGTDTWQRLSSISLPRDLTTIENSRFRRLHLTVLNINQKIRQSIRLIILIVLVVWIDVASAVSQEGVSKAKDHASRGLQFAQNGDLKRAESELRRAVESAPRNPLYWSDLGSILRAQKKHWESLRKRLEKYSKFCSTVLKQKSTN